MAEKVSFVPYTAACRQPVLDLLDSKPFKQSIWDWQFVENPLATPFNPVILVDKWGTIIGFNGTMPVRIKCDDRTITGLWSCDFIVDERFHSKGHGKRIKDELHRRAPLIMALGISDMAAPVLLRMGWKKNNVVDSYRKLNHFSEPRSAVLAGIQYLNRLRSSAQSSSTARPEIRMAGRLPDAPELDRLWLQVEQGYTRIVIRDHAYLHWRYAQHPLCAYQYLTAWRDNSLLALAVVRITPHAAHLIDYVGPAESIEIKTALLDKLLSITTKQAYLACSTSDREWKQVLLNSGFYKQQSKPRFYIHAAPELAPDVTEGWFIMGGDSDGDMLKASEEGPFVAADLSKTYPRAGIRIRKLTEQEFTAAEQEWNHLLARADADPLFLGWTWLSQWWQQWASQRGYSLYILAAYNRGNELVGIAPLYKTRVRMPFADYTQIQFIGSSWSGRETVRSEYLDFIIDIQHADEVRERFVMFLTEDADWDQLVLSDMNARSLTRKYLEQHRWFNHCYTRVVQTDTGIVIDVTKPFAEYVANMGRNTRVSTFNHRRNLESLGEVIFEYATTGTTDDYLDSLNELHARRWGKPCFPPESLQFHKKIADAMSRQGRLRLSRIVLSGQPVSVLYNIQVAGREYNIQAGFDPAMDRKLSPGFLHLGYAIEAAFADRTLQELDLLAGSGKKTFYKSRFGSGRRKFITLQLNRTVYLKRLYRVYDVLPEKIRALIKQGLKRNHN